MEEEPLSKEPLSRNKLLGIWNGQPIYIKLVNINISSRPGAEAGTNENRTIYTALFNKDKTGFPLFNGFTNESVILNIIHMDPRMNPEILYENPSGGPGLNSIIMFFTTNISGDGKIIELYDLFKNYRVPREFWQLATSAAPNPAAGTGKAIGFLKTVVLNKFRNKKRQGTGAILWLGTVEPKLAVEYAQNNFTLLNPPRQTPTGIVSTPHSLSPLGINFPSSGISFIYPLDPDIPEHLPTMPIIRIKTLTLQQKLKSYVAPHYPEFIVSISQTNCHHIYENLVMNGSGESGLIFANTKTTVQPDIDAIWTGDNYKVDVDSVSVSMRTYNSRIPIKSPVYGRLQNHIVGHTHPAILYVRDGELDGSGNVFVPVNKHQDISPPSAGDYIAILFYKNPLHLIWSPECVYSIRLHPKLLENTLTLTPEELFALNRKNIIANVDRLATINTTSPLFWPAEFKTIMDRVFTGIMLPIDAGGNFVGIANLQNDAYRKMKMAKILTVRNVINNIFNIGGVQLIEFNIHLYDHSVMVRGINPLPSFKSDKPYKILMSDQLLIKETQLVETYTQGQQEANAKKYREAATASEGGPGPVGQGGPGPEPGPVGQGGPGPTVAAESKHSKKTIPQMKTELKEKYGYTNAMLTEKFVEKKNIIAELEELDQTGEDKGTNIIYTLKAPVDKLLEYAKLNLVRLRPQDAPPGVFVGGMKVIKKIMTKKRKAKRNAKAKKTRKN
jgi:hypothetical protein